MRVDVDLIITILAVITYAAFCVGLWLGVTWLVNRWYRRH